MVYYHHSFTFGVTFQRYQDLPSAPSLCIPVGLPPFLTGLKWVNLKSSRCSFIDVIEVTPAQMEKAGVSHFECPMCLAVRDIQPKGGKMKFTSHPKRTTNTPNHGLRWVNRGNSWEIFG